MIGEAFQNGVGILKALLILFRFVEFDYVLEEVGLLFGEGTVLARLGIAVVVIVGAGTNTARGGGGGGGGGVAHYYCVCFQPRAWPHDEMRLREGCPREFGLQH